MKLITARELPTQYFFQVHTDETKLKLDGTPDPAYVREFTWGKTPPTGVTKAQYLTSIQREIKLLVDAETTATDAADPTKATKLTIEGATL